MTYADLANALQRAGITPVEKTFRELSESNPSTGPKTYATIEGGYCASLRGIDFDKTTELAHPELPLTVKSADVLYANGGVTYLIEFKDRNAVLVEKQHLKTIASSFVKGGKFGLITVIDAQQNRQINTEELLVACDLLITDYSSIYYDFYLMNRPVIHYAYDYDHFMNVDMGFNYDIREYGGGPFAYDEDTLIKYLLRSDEELLKLRNEKTKEQLSFETGHACEAYYNLLEKLCK